MCKRILFIAPSRTYLEKSGGLDYFKPFSDPQYRMFWHGIKTLGIHTPRHRYLYANEGDGTLDRHVTAETGLIVLLGEELYPLLAKEESFDKMQGSLVPYKGTYVLPTYHPQDLRTKRFIRNGGGVDYYETWFKHLEKAKNFCEDSFVIPPENFVLEPTAEQAISYIRDGISNNVLFSCDLETLSLRPDKGGIVMFGLSKERNEGLCVPFYNQTRGPYFSPNEVFRVKEALQELLEHGRHMWQNSLFDLRYLLHHGYRIDYKTLIHDTMLLHHSIYAELPHRIGFINGQYGYTPYWKDDFLSSDLPILDRNQLDTRRYNLRDCAVLHDVLPRLLEDLHELGTEKAYMETLSCVKPAIEQMDTGIFIDFEQVKKFKAEVSKHYTASRKRIYTLGNLPQAFNPKSGDHLAFFIFKQPLPQFKNLDADLRDFEPVAQEAFRCASCNKKTWLSSEAGKTQPPCACGSLSYMPLAKPEFRSKARRAKEVRGKEAQGYRKLLDIKELRDAKPLYKGNLFGKMNPDTGKMLTDVNERFKIIGALAERRQDVRSFIKQTPAVLQEQQELNVAIEWMENFSEFATYEKQRSTYTTFPTWDDGRIHSNVLLHGTATGRPASTGPNMLNFPKDLRGFRQCLVAPPGKAIVSIDYAAIEAVMLAYISGDPKFIEAVQSGNLHNINTELLFKITPAHKAWGKARAASKIFQFGHIQYGGAPRNIWRKVCVKCPELPLPYNQFLRASEHYFKVFEIFGAWHKETTARALKDRTVASPFGRIRRLYGSDHSRQRQALNFPAQSGAGHVMNTVMAECIEARDRAGLRSRLQIQIYDDLKWEAPLEEIHELIALTKPIMEQPFSINGIERTFPAEPEVGLYWADDKMKKDPKAMYVYNPKCDYIAKYGELHAL